MSAPRYRLRYITDLLDIPEDRLDACLAELRELLPIMRQQMAGFSAVLRAEVECAGIEWVDDKAATLTTRFGAGDRILAEVTIEGALTPEESR